MSLLLAHCVTSGRPVLPYAQNPDVSTGKMTELNFRNLLVPSSSESLQQWRPFQTWVDLALGEPRDRSGAVCSGWGGRGVVGRILSLLTLEGAPPGLRGVEAEEPAESAASALHRPFRSSPSPSPPVLALQRWEAGPGPAEGSLAVAAKKEPESSCWSWPQVCPGRRLQALAWGQGSEGAAHLPNWASTQLSGLCFQSCQRFAAPHSDPGRQGREQGTRPLVLRWQGLWLQGPGGLALRLFPDLFALSPLALPSCHSFWVIESPSTEQSQS